MPEEDTCAGALSTDDNMPGQTLAFLCRKLHIQATRGNPYGTELLFLPLSPCGAGPGLAGYGSLDGGPEKR